MESWPESSQDRAGMGRSTTALVKANCKQKKEMVMAEVLSMEEECYKIKAVVVPTRKLDNP